MSFQIHEVTEVNGLTRVTIARDEVMDLKDIAISAAAQHLTEYGYGDLELRAVEQDTTDFFLYYSLPQVEG